MKPSDARIAELTARIAQLEREKQVRTAGRDSTPVLPRQGRWIGVTNGELAQGGTVAVTVWLMNNGSLVASSTVIEGVKDGFLAEGKSLPAGSRVLVFWYQSAWFCLLTAETDIVHFELVEDLPVTNHAQAKRLKLVAGAWVDDEGPRIEVYDWYGPEGMWRGKVGYRGLAIRRPDSFEFEGEEGSEDDETRAAYDIIWVEQKARVIHFTTSERMSQTTAGQVSVTVTGYDDQGKDPGNTLIVHDPQGRFPDVHAGAKGTARYFHRADEYRITSVQRVAVFATATITANICGGSSVAIDNFAIREVGDYVGTPTAPATVDCPCVMGGRSGDRVLLRRTNNSMPTPSWEVTRIDKHLVNLPWNVTEDSEGLKIVRRPFYLEYCDDTETTDEAAFLETTDECLEE